MGPWGCDEHGRDTVLSTATTAAVAAQGATGQAPELGGVAGWAVGVMEALGAPGAGLVVLLENVFPPIPSEVILPLAGFTASQGSFSVLSAIVWTGPGDRGEDPAGQRHGRRCRGALVRQARLPGGVLRADAAHHPQCDLRPRRGGAHAGRTLRAVHRAGQRDLEHRVRPRRLPARRVLVGRRAVRGRAAVRGPRSGRGAGSWCPGCAGVNGPGTSRPVDHRGPTPRDRGAGPSPLRRGPTAGSGGWRGPSRPCHRGRSDPPPRAGR